MVQHRRGAHSGERVGTGFGFLQTQTHRRKMNRKQLVILLVLVVVLGGAALLIRNKEAASSQSGHATIGQKLLGNFAVNDVAHIVLKQGTNELNLAKKEELWRVRERNDYPAN